MDTSYDADVALYIPFRDGGIETGFAVRALQGLRLEGYRVVLIDATTRTSRSARNKAHMPLLDLLEPTCAFVAQPGREYRVQCAMAVSPSLSVPYEDLEVGVAADGTVLVADRAFADPSTSSDSDVSARVRQLAHATNSSPVIGVLNTDDRARFTEMNFVVSPDEWVLGAPRSALKEPRKRLANDENIRIGRHSSFEEPVWPAESEVVRRALPTTSGWDVRIYGPHRRLLKLLGRKPARWSMHHVVGPRDLKDIDFWVLGHDGDPAIVQDLAIDEAIAAGLVVILPQSYAYYFGRGAIYSTVRSSANALAASPQKFASQSARAIEFAKWHCAETVVERLGSIGLGPPTTFTKSSAPSRVPRDDRDRFRVMLVTSNGAGMGHLTRLIAAARRIGEEVEVVFVSLSQASPIVEKFGYPFVYIASSAESGLDARSWNDYIFERFTEEFERFRPDSIVFDGTWIYAGLSRALRNAGVPTVWSRRGMWKPGVSDRSLAHESDVDSVVEPGDIAAAADRGATTRIDAALRINPVTIIDRDELLTTTESRAHLGLEQSEQAVLITLGATGNIGGTVEEFVEAFEYLAPSWQIFMTSNPIEVRQREFYSVSSLEHYPIVELGNGFDAVVSAAGYNSVHEWLMACVPSIWLPNLNTQTDDQEARARFLDSIGAGITVIHPTRTAIREAVAQIVDRGVRAEIKSVLNSRLLPSGATDLGRHILAHAKGEVR